MRTELFRVKSGLDLFSLMGFSPLKGRRVGAICNPTSVDRWMHHLADLLLAADISLVALFAPEHGVRGDAQDMIEIAPERDARTGVPVHSLYGPTTASLSPTAEQLEGIDCLVFDLQDVGSRYYTFAATMLYAMKAAAGRGIPFYVFDRPNPLGGLVVEGPTVSPGYESFVGAYPLPIRHGMTVAELASLFVAELKLDLELLIAPCIDWTRRMLWSDTGRPWISPSPNMPTPDTALVYPGGCLLEGTNLSEGRGTTRPFELWGAPWIDPHALIERIGAVPGAILRPCAFRPTFHKHAGKLCHGVQPIVVDPSLFRSTSLYAAMIAEARAQQPQEFAWRTESYEFVSEPIAIDLLFGSARGRSLIEAGSRREETVSIADFEDSWRRDVRDFEERRRPFLLYGEGNDDGPAKLVAD